MKCQMSEAEKAELLYSLYEQEMYRVCLAILNDRYAAEDAVSESFLKLLKIRDRIVDPRDASCKRYAIKTAKNTAIDMYRKNVREREMCGEFNELTESEISREVFHSDSADLTASDIIDGLSKKYRDVIECICINGLTVHETSAVLKISEACVRKRLERARRQLADVQRKSNR